MNYEDNDYLEAVRMCEEYKNQGLSNGYKNSQTAKPTNETPAPNLDNKTFIEEVLSS